ncbi:restriction endonuclease, SacI family [Microbacterium sp. YY-03]|uniref:restriction endonuclease, SacI family n=1 Tax=Microbacterium sp. YY-03 TaxID=3421636 RepID=UPI003D179083
MPIKISPVEAEGVLLDALTVAKTGQPLPIVWTSYSRMVFSLDAMTWTPALVTLLLAKATNQEVDTLSLKHDEANPFSYSARGLCHGVIVPAAVQHNFTIRNTGREPLNNQPFFRYDRIDKIERTRNPDDTAVFLEVATAANSLSANDAFDALAAFLREALTRTAAARKVSVPTSGLSVSGARIAAQDFLRHDAKDRPQRLQAFAAACVSLMQFSHVRTRRINDPSRDVPGDVQAIVNEKALFAMEVRGKPVSQTELIGFVRECSTAGVHRAVMLVDAAGQKPLNLESAMLEANAPEVLTVAFESADQLLQSALLWTNEDIDKSVKTFSENLLRRLQEIEASQGTLEEWVRAVAVAQRR